MLMQISLKGDILSTWKNFLNRNESSSKMFSSFLNNLEKKKSSSLRVAYEGFFVIEVSLKTSPYVRRYERIMSQQQ